MWAVFPFGIAAVLIYTTKFSFSEALQGFKGVLICLAIAVILAGGYLMIPYLVRVSQKCQLWILGDEPMNLVTLLRIIGAVVSLLLIGLLIGPIWGAILLAKKMDQKLTTVVRWIQDKNKW